MDLRMNTLLNKLNEFTSNVQQNKENTNFYILNEPFKCKANVFRLIIIHNKNTKDVKRKVLF